VGAADEVFNAVAVHWALLVQDLRYAALNRARGFALTAILVTALGVGANSAAFSVDDFVLLRQLPFPEPQFAADAAVLGRSVQLNGAPYTIIPDGMRLALVGLVAGVFVA
jgi:hypothetical protein